MTHFEYHAYEMYYVLHLFCVVVKGWQNSWPRVLYPVCQMSAVETDGCGVMTEVMTDTTKPVWTCRSGQAISTISWLSRQ